LYWVGIYLISGVKEKYLQTVIPSQGDKVIVVSWKYRNLKGQRGTLLEKSDKNEEAIGK